MLCGCRAERPLAVGPLEARGMIVPTEQLIRPAGESVAFHGRPVDVAIAPDGQTAYVKSNGSLLAIDMSTWTIRQELKYLEKSGGGSMHGLLVWPDGKRVLVTLQSYLAIANVGADGTLAWAGRIPIAGATAKRHSYPCGLAKLDADRVLVCLSMKNALAVVNLTSQAVEKEIPVGVAPYDVASSRDGTTAFVSNWGGRRPVAGDRVADSAGSNVVVDDRGIGSCGSVGVIDLNAGKQTAEISTGLHPAEIELSGDGSALYVANANSDTVSVIDTRARSVRDTINVRPGNQLPFGSASNALTFREDGTKLFVANGGNNAIAVIDLRGAAGKLEGFIPTGWYPGAVAVRNNSLIIANVKGMGSRDPADAGKWNSHAYWGTVTRVTIPANAATLASYTEQVRKDARVPQALLAWEKAQSGRKTLPLPERAGEPSSIEHVVYIIKENRTYDQLFGDLPRGNNDPKLCVFGREVTPNHHAIAEQFVQLDNFYCNGVLSADGHAWATQGVAVDYLEKSFGGWSRSYPFAGDDALAIAPSGFIWDNALLHGKSFRNYGEMSTTSVTPPGRWLALYSDWKCQARTRTFTRKMSIEALQEYSCEASPGWNLDISDQVRADVFLKEFVEAEKSGQWQNLTILYLPQDHTAGTSPEVPTPAATVADNDLALGRVVDAISHSRFWPKTCIFVVEDDPQAGFDHVDGHRSICLVASPYAKRGAVVSKFYNQTSVLHTMELMLGLPPMNQFDAMAPAMKDVFTKTPDLRAYNCLPNNIPLDQMNPAKATLSDTMRELASQSEKLPLDKPDLADENTLNRIIWHAMKGADAPYPAEFAGAHGKGLNQLRLRLDSSVPKDDDDD